MSYETHSSPCCWTYKVTLTRQSQAALGSHAGRTVHSRVKYKLSRCHLLLCLFICPEEAGSPCAPAVPYLKSAFLRGPQ